MANDKPRARGVVFFDLVGTLIEGRSGIGHQYAELARTLGVDADDGLVERAFRRAMERAPAMAFPSAGPIEVPGLERAWWRRLVETVVVDARLADRLTGATFDAYFDRLYDHFTTAAAWRVYDDVPAALRRCRERGLAVGLITNYDSRVNAVLGALGLSALLDSVTIPAHVGSAKPAPAIFTHALALHQLEPSAAVYVGDSLEDDYHGALGAGMRALLLDRAGRRRGAPEITRIESLAELYP
jgi:putative hydrolase of the HAD superfamily